MEIREIQESDWAAVWPFFDEIVTEGETYAYSAALTSETARELWVERPPRRTCGCWARSRPARTAPARVRTSRRRVSWSTPRLVGGRSGGRSAGFHAMQFNAVVETNTGAVALWRSLGFQLIGTVPEAFDHPEFGFVGLHVVDRRL